MHLTYFSMQMLMWYILNLSRKYRENKWIAKYCNLSYYLNPIRNKDKNPELWNNRFELRRRNQPANSIVVDVAALCKRVMCVCEQRAVASELYANDTPAQIHINTSILHNIIHTRTYNVQWFRYAAYARFAKSEIDVTHKSAKYLHCNRDKTRPCTWYRTF